MSTFFLFLPVDFCFRLFQSLRRADMKKLRFVDDKAKPAALFGGIETVAKRKSGSCFVVKNSAVDNGYAGKHVRVSGFFFFVAFNRAGRGEPVVTDAFVAADVFQVLQQQQYIVFFYLQGWYVS